MIPNKRYQDLYKWPGDYETWWRVKD